MSSSLARSASAGSAYANPAPRCRTTPGGRSFAHWFTAAAFEQTSSVRARSTSATGSSSFELGPCGGGRYARDRLGSADPPIDLAQPGELECFGGGAGEIPFASGDVGPPVEHGHADGPAVV